MEVGGLTIQTSHLTLLGMPEYTEGNGFSQYAVFAIYYYHNWRTFMSDFNVTDLAIDKLKEYMEQNKIDSALRIALMQGG